MDYGRGIIAARTKRGLSKRKLAARAGLVPSYITHLESGKKVPSLAAVEAISRALDIPVYLLMLLSSDEAELKGIDSPGAQSLAMGLLDLLPLAEDAGNEDAGQA
jgi:transcriptional regulator with XRE-family HTH domain